MLARSELYTFVGHFPRAPTTFSEGSQTPLAPTPTTFETEVGQEP